MTDTEWEYPPCEIDRKLTAIRLAVGIAVRQGKRLSLAELKDVHETLCDICEMLDVPRLQVVHEGEPTNGKQN